MRVCVCVCVFVCFLRDSKQLSKLQVQKVWGLRVQYHTLQKEFWGRTIILHFECFVFCDRENSPAPGGLIN